MEGPSWKVLVYFTAMALSRAPPNCMAYCTGIWLLLPLLACQLLFRNLQVHGTKNGALPISLEKRPCGKKVTLVANVTNPGALIHELKSR